MDSKKPLYKTITFWVVVLSLLYSTLGLFAVPYFIEKELKKIASNDLNSQLTVADISFNPYTISLDIIDLKLRDEDNSLWFSADKIHTNLHLWISIFKNLSLAKIHLQKPYFYLKTKKTNDSIQLQYPQIIATSDSQQSSQLVLDIDDIEINNGSISYDDDSRDKHINLNIQEIIFHNQKFTTADNDSEFDLSFITENNEETRLSGKFNFSKSNLTAIWSLKNWSTDTIFNFMSDKDNKFLGFQNKSGQIDADGSLNFTDFKNSLPNILINSLQLINFSTKTNNNQQPIIALPQLQLSHAEVDLNKQAIIIDNIDSEQTEVTISITEDYNLLIDDFAQTANQTNDSNEQAWNFHIKNINLNSGLLHLSKEFKNENHINDLNFNNINILNLSNNQQKSDINISLNTDGEGQIDIQAKLQLTPLNLNSHITFNDTNIAKWQAWLPSDINLTIDQGLLSLQQNLVFTDDDFSSEGHFVFNNIKLLDNNKQPFLSINRLDLSESHIDSSKKSISLNNIILDQAQGTLTVSDTQQLNIDTIISSNERTRNESEIDTKGKDWVIEIKQIELIDSQTKLIDKSIKPSYHTELSKLNGNIKGLSSSNLSKADIELSGVLDTYAKININGQINLLADDAYTDLSINIENLSLQNFSSYSAQYLGFPITRGKADFELNYQLNQNLLQGINNLTFKQLQFGEKNHNKEAINLPLKLAVNLLTDGKGIMKINLPVSGNIDDPEFSYGGIIFKAMFKLITGIVASPFKLLGKLIPGGADLDLSGIQFEAGSVTLSSGEEGKLKAIKQIIKQKPAIILELTGITNTINDSKVLQRQLLLKSLNLPKQINFSNASLQTSIKKLYISTFSAEKWAQTETNATKDQHLDSFLLTENCWDELLAAQDIIEQLDLLAKQRAQYIQQLLIEKHAISQDKIFLKPSEQSEDLYPQVKFGIGI
ncbi:MAG: DUF748 domain-containing protein [Alcanivoracaceae bacterium]|nr:DUF748 domain-containing protein [Alcanivoracaceae bacterium]